MHRWYLYFPTLAFVGLVVLVMTCGTVASVEAWARARFGRPSSLSPETLERVERMHLSGQSVRAIAELLGVGVATVHRAIVKLRASTPACSESLPRQSHQLGA